VVPELEPVVPAFFLEDDLLPSGLALVEPSALVLEYAAAAWGPRGPRN